MTDQSAAAAASGTYISRRTFEDTVRRAILCEDPTATWRMKRVAAAAALLVAGRPGRDLRAPEPIVQVGFEPDEQEMGLMVAEAVERRRDLIHVSCHVDGSGTPTGMIAVVYHDDYGPHAHRRCSLLCAPGSDDVLLSGVSDVEDEVHHFVLKAARKMTRVPGLPAPDLAAGMHRAGEKWLELVAADGLGDCRGERVHVYGLAPPITATG